MTKLEFLALINAELGIDLKLPELDMNFQQINIDEIDVMTLVMSLESDFNVDIDVVDEWTTFADVMMGFIAARAASSCD